MEDKPELPAKRKRNLIEEQNPSLKISDLPDAIIQHILSFATVEDAVKFCTLSKQWIRLWTSISNLSFFCKQKNITHFASSVDKALSLYSAAKVKKFLLEFPYRDRFRGRVKSWICFSLTHGVEELYLDFPRYGALLCTKLFDWFDNWCGMSLKVISFDFLTLDMKMIKAIFRGSPLLECFKLRGCNLMKRFGSNFVIDATTTRLKNLVLDDCSLAEILRIVPRSTKGFVEIRGPNLVSLTLGGYVRFHYFKLLHLSSLVEANINLVPRRSYNLEEKTFVKDILDDLRHVSRLAIEDWFLQVLQNMILDGENISPLGCKILKINVSTSNWCYFGTEFLLRNSPSLEQVIINMTYPRRCERKVEVEESYCRSKTRSFRCLNHNLKRVEITGFVTGNSSWNRGEILLDVVRYLLDNATVLQKLTVLAQVDKLNRSVEPVQPKKSKALFEESKTLLAIKKKVLHFPKTSPGAVVMFKRVDCNFKGDLL